MELKGSKTEQNLMTAFAGEAQANTRYRLFADAARQDGYAWLSAIFEDISEQELAHAAIWLDKLGEIGRTAANLATAVDGETYEYTDMYQRFAREAEEDGFPALAEKFRAVGKIEECHARLFQNLLTRLEGGTLFESPTETLFRCENCGYTHTGHSAPEHCPVCGYPRGYFHEIAADEWPEDAPMTGAEPPLLRPEGTQADT